MNKKILATIFAALILIGSVVLAAVPPPGSGNGNQGSDTTDGRGQQSDTSQQTQNQGGETQLQNIVATRAKNAQELKEIVKQSRINIQNSTNQIKSQLQEMHQNQNRVRVAVHAMLAAENLTGGIGRNVSQIAREFNNSVQSTTRAEEKIRTRSSIVKFFMGGDEEAAEDIEQEVNKNQNRLQELNQLMENCNCDPEVKATLQEQIQNVEQEQERLRQLAQEEKGNKGIFGWLFK